MITFSLVVMNLMTSQISRSIYASEGEKLLYTAAFSVLICLVTIFLAFYDSHLLRKFVQPTAASGWWILLTPIAYLAARAVHTRRHQSKGWWYFSIYLTTFVITLVANVVFFDITGGTSIVPYLQK